MTPAATAVAATAIHTEDEVSAGATLQVDRRAERFSMYALEAHMLPRLYWHGMLRGRA